MSIETYIINHIFHVAMALGNSSQVPIPITKTIYLSFGYIDTFHGQSFYFFSTILIYFYMLLLEQK